jgi:hypothetical protein
VRKCLRKKAKPQITPITQTRNSSRVETPLICHPPAIWSTLMKILVLPCQRNTQNDAKRFYEIQKGVVVGAAGWGS